MVSHLKGLCDFLLVVNIILALSLTVSEIRRLFRLKKRTFSDVLTQNLRMLFCTKSLNILPKAVTLR